MAPTRTLIPQLFSINADTPCKYSLELILNESCFDSMLQFLKMARRSGDKRTVLNWILPFISRFFRFKDPNQNGLKYWRERIVFSVLAAGVGLSLLALVPTVRMAITERLWTLLVFDILAAGSHHQRLC